MAKPTKKQEEKSDEIVKDLYKYCDKINAMMVASVEGEAPSYFKIILFKRMADFAHQRYAEAHSKEANEEAHRLVEKFIKASQGEMKTLSEEEYKKRFKEKFK